MLFSFVVFLPLVRRWTILDLVLCMTPNLLLLFLVPYGFLAAEVVLTVSAFVPFPYCLLLLVSAGSYPQCNHYDRHHSIVAEYIYHHGCEYQEKNDCYFYYYIYSVFTFSSRSILFKASSIDRVDCFVYVVNWSSSA